MFNVKIYNWPGYNLDELPKEVIEYLEKEDGPIDQDNIPRWMKERSLLVVTHNGEIVFTAIDGGEPEDQSFCRDLSWIPGIIQRAYNIGKSERSQ